MDVKCQVAELGEVKAEVDASLQHAILRLGKIRQEFIEMHEPLLTPAIEQLTATIGGYTTFLQ
jgi:hypothetical protein